MNLRALGRFGLAGSALVALALTSGCQTRIGEAASVGDSQIATSQLTGVTGRSIAAAAASGTPVPAAQEAEVQRNVLNLLVQVVLLRDIAAAQQVSATAAELATERSTEAQQAGGDQALVAESAKGGLSATDLPLVIERKVLITKLQTRFRAADSTAFTNALTAAARKIVIRVNPRFGRWDAKTLTIVAAGDDLSSTSTKS